MNKLIRKYKVVYFLFIVAAIFIIIGGKNGNVKELYNAASLICLECIGIG